MSDLYDVLTEQKNTSETLEKIDEQDNTSDYNKYNSEAIEISSLPGPYTLADRVITQFEIRNEPLPEGIILKPEDYTRQDEWTPRYIASHVLQILKFNTTLLYSKESMFYKRVLLLDELVYDSQKFAEWLRDLMWAYKDKGINPFIHDETEEKSEGVSAADSVTDNNSTSTESDVEPTAEVDSLEKEDVSKTTNQSDHIIPELSINNHFSSEELHSMWKFQKGFIKKNQDILDTCKAKDICVYFTTLINDLGYSKIFRKFRKYLLSERLIPIVNAELYFFIILILLYALPDIGYFYIVKMFKVEGIYKDHIIKHIIPMLKSDEYDDEENDDVGTDDIKLIEEYFVNRTERGITQINDKYNALLSDYRKVVSSKGIPNMVVRFIDYYKNNDKFMKDCTNRIFIYTLLLISPYSWIYLNISTLDVNYELFHARLFFDHLILSDDYGDDTSRLFPGDPLSA